MISLAVSLGGRGVSVGCQVMKLCGSVVRALWHGVPPAILDAVSGKCNARPSNEVGDLIRCQRNSEPKKTSLLGGILLGVLLAGRRCQSVAVLGMRFRSLGAVMNRLEVVAAHPSVKPTPSAPLQY
jgi:hypothetical protein